MLFTTRAKRCVVGYLSLMSALSRSRRRKTATFLLVLALLTGVTVAFPRSSCSLALVDSSPAMLPLSQQNSGIEVGQSYDNDVSPPLRDLATRWSPQASERFQFPILSHGMPGPAPANGPLRLLVPDVMPSPILNMDGIPFPGVACACAPPSDNGEVGATQYVQVVVGTFQVFDKNTGQSLLGPTSISSLWAGFGGTCQGIASSFGDPQVLYDQMANRWVISQPGPADTFTDQCIAVSTTSDATGTWNRYAFHLGSNIFTEPRLSVWPDAYYMSINVFNGSGTTFLGPKPYAFERARMLAGETASFISTGITVGPDEAPYLPADFDGSILPPTGAPNSFVEFPAHGTYRIFHFHTDFVTPANSTFTLFSSPPAAPFTVLCPGTTLCVPAGTAMLDGHGNRLMYRLAYRNFGTTVTPNESLVGNYSVSSSGVAGIRWFEFKNVTAGPVTIAQEGTHQPDTIWRWLGSAAMDQVGNLAVGYSASDSSTSPQIRYAGRLVTDPPNTLAQGEAHLFDPSGIAQVPSGPWGPISAMTVDPVDDCTFWYTNEYYANVAFAWRTRIGNFKFDQCTSQPTPPPSPTPTATISPTPSPTATSSPTPSCVGHDQQCVDAYVFKSDSPDPVEVGQDLTYTINVGITAGITGLFL